jgi:hypothetical protein
VLRSGVPIVVDDGGSIDDGVSCAAHVLALPGGDVGCVGVVVPLPRLPRGLLAPLGATVNRIATLLATQALPSATPL